MGDLAEDRVYEGDAETTEVYVAAGIGVVRVEAAGERVGEFGIDRRCVARDVAADAARVAVATDGDLLLRNGEYRETGAGRAVAVGFVDGSPIAADGTGRIVLLDDDGTWSDLGDLDVAVRAIDGALLATDDGVYRLADGGFEPLGLDDVRDVAAGTEPLAATGDGLHAFDDGWTRVLDGPVETVSVAPTGVAHAATPGALYERRGSEWTPVEVPVAESVVGVCYGDCPYAVTEDGTLLTGEGEWRPHPLGVADVVGVAVR